jgi:hypothetical protein
VGVTDLNKTFGGPGMAVADHGMEMAFAAIR